ncbi:hypothetical protein ACHAW5_006411 [Stephanodiscus triporus]|uniref:RanBP2-type domain-containing protein n=1 Tax=Stephanodiscus triporus TaxID=2934178 RepID=A0ABD3NN34_9STRA
MNGSGRSLCKVIGCGKLDQTNDDGFCRMHFNMFAVEGADDDLDGWTCAYRGQPMGGRQKRCGNCQKVKLLDRDASPRTIDDVMHVYSSHSLASFWKLSKGKVSRDVSPRTIDDVMHVDSSHSLVFFTVLVTLLFCAFLSNSGGEVNASHTKSTKTSSTMTTAVSHGHATAETLFPPRNLDAGVVTIGEEAGAKAGGSWGPLEENMTAMMVWIGLRIGRAAVRPYPHSKLDVESVMAGEVGSASLCHISNPGSKRRCGGCLVWKATVQSSESSKSSKLRASFGEANMGEGGSTPGGHWQCKKCSFDNFASELECFYCQSIWPNYQWQKK